MSEEGDLNLHSLGETLSLPQPSQTTYFLTYLLQEVIPRDSSMTHGSHYGPRHVRLGPIPTPPQDPSDPGLDPYT